MTLKPPSPGSWILDAEHCERAHTRFMSMIPDVYTAGFRKSMEHYGLLLDTLEGANVEGFMYICARPLGAPKGATKLPPRWIFKLMLKLHPVLRSRVRRAEEVLATKPWRAEAAEFAARRPRLEAELLAFQDEPIETYDQAKLCEHVRRTSEYVERMLYEHFCMGCSSLIPVGDLIAHVCEWTGAEDREVVKLLRGASPHSLDACAGLDRLIDAIAASEEGQRALEAEDALRRLSECEGEVGAAFESWYRRVKHRVLTGHDVSELRALEAPESLIAVLRSGLIDRDKPRPSEDGPAKLRERVPEKHRAEYDELVAEARTAYPLRDSRAMVDYWAIGVARRAVLEAGGRLVRAGRLDAADHAVDLTAAEIVSLLGGGSGPSREEVRGFVEKRRSSSVENMPPHLGTPPSPPPPPEWMPPASARVQRAVNTYISMMFAPPEPQPSSSSGRAPPPRSLPGAVEVVEGLAAAPGVHRGRARLVLSPDAFDRIERGDVLVARITNPTYNVLLPMLGAIVTDRGGLLSHPAIVAREYGLPAVVGSGDATRRITDGALVEVDGTAGRVRILS